MGTPPAALNVPLVPLGVPNEHEPLAMAGAVEADNRPPTVPPRPQIVDAEVVPPLVPPLPEQVPLVHVQEVAPIIEPVAPPGAGLDANINLAYPPAPEAMGVPAPALDEQIVVQEVNNASTAVHPVGLPPPPVPREAPERLGAGIVPPPNQVRVQPAMRLDLENNIVELPSQDPLMTVQEVGQIPPVQRPTVQVPVDVHDAPTSRHRSARPTLGSPELLRVIEERPEMPPQPLQSEIPLRTLAGARQLNAEKRQTLHLERQRYALEREQAAHRIEAAEREAEAAERKEASMTKQLKMAERIAAIQESQSSGTVLEPDRQKVFSTAETTVPKEVVPPAYDMTRPSVTTGFVHQNPSGYSTLPAPVNPATPAQQLVTTPTMNQALMPVVTHQAMPALPPPIPRVPVGDTVSASSHSPTAHNDYVAVMVQQNISKENPKKFGGDPLEYQEFLLDYQQSTTGLGSDPRTCLNILRNMLQGKALQSIKRSYVAIDPHQALAEALEILETSYGTPLKQCRAQLEKLMARPRVSPTEAGLLEFEGDLIHCYRIMERCGRTNKLDSEQVLKELFNKLPDYLQIKWENEIDDRKERGEMAEPTFKLLVDVIKREHRKKTSDLNQWREENKQKKKEAHKDDHKKVTKVNATKMEPQVQLSSSHWPSLPTASSSTNNQGATRSCLCSPPVLHNSLEFCPLYQQADTVEKRRQLIRKCRACFKCLGFGHFASRCNKTACPVANCGRNHHPSLHMERSRVNNRQQTASRQNQEARRSPAGHHSVNAVQQTLPPDNGQPIDQPCTSQSAAPSETQVKVPR